MAFLDSIVATNPADSEDIRLGASRIRALADATKTTFAVEHNEADGTHTYGAGGSGGGGAGHAARAYQNALQSIPNNTLTKVQFNAESWDLDNEFDSATNYRFTPTVAGLYQVNTAVTFVTNATGIRRCEIRKNGSPHTRGTNVDAVTVASLVTTVAASDIFDMNGSTDYIEVFCSQTSGGALNIVGTSAAETVFVSIAKLIN